MKRYHELSPRDLLNQKGDFNINAPANIRGDIEGFLNLGRGCKGSMEKLVEQIEARVKELMDFAAHSGSLTPPPEQPPPGVSIVPPDEKPDNNRF